MYEIYKVMFPNRSVTTAKNRTPCIECYSNWGRGDLRYITDFNQKPRVPGQFAQLSIVRASRSAHYIVSGVQISLITLYLFACSCNVYLRCAMRQGLHLKYLHESLSLLWDKGGSISMYNIIHHIPYFRIEIMHWRTGFITYLWTPSCVDVPIQTLDLISLLVVLCFCIHSPFPDESWPTYCWRAAAFSSWPAH